MKTNKKGISLIVLVITIVVMIILAAAIILSLRSDGIIGRANQAKSTTDASNAKDLVAVARSEWTVEKDEIMDNEGVSTFKEYAEKRLRESGYKITTTTDDKEGSVEVLADGTVYIYPVIPEGFVASDIATEDQVSEGLVIYEGIEKVSKDSDAMTTRNQFVWVPVNSMGDFILKDGYYNGTLLTDVSKGRVSEPYSGLASDSTGEIAEYKAMKKSVEKYGGFYIARYEAGVVSGKVVSKKGKEVYNVISWGESMDSIGTEGAVAKSRGMYEENDSFVSHLIYGVEWDAAASFMSKKDMQYFKGLTKKGWTYENYTKSNPIAGDDIDASASNMVNNIYDMGGNVGEWTMEAKGTDTRVVRGSDYGSEYVDISTRGGYSPESYDWAIIGFRVALYLK